MVRFVTVTKQSGRVSPTEKRGDDKPTRCAWCSRALPTRSPQAIGRRAIYCRRSCRQRAYEARRRSAELGIGDDDLVITRNELDDANDRLFEIRLLAADARRDLDDRLAATRVLSRLLDGIDAVIATN